MGDQTKGGIAWTDETWNPVRGCSRVSPGCENCYAERQAARFIGPGQPYEGLAKRSPKGLPLWTGEVQLIASHLADPLRWTRPRRVFVNSMSDLFHEKLENEEIAAVFGVMAAARRHTFQILTKRPQRMREWFEWVRGAEAWEELVRDEDERVTSTLDLIRTYARLQLENLNDYRAIPIGHEWPLPNVILGVTAEDQQRWDERVPILLDTPAALRMVSVEPQLGPVDISGLTRCAACGYTARDQRIHGDHHLCGNGAIPRTIDWVITGGESGPGARPYDIAWARQLVAECDAAGVACFVKQLGDDPIDSAGELGPTTGKGKDLAEWPASLRIQQFPAAR